MKGKRILLIAVLLLVGVLVLVGCNGDNGDDNGVADDNGDDNGVVDGDEDGDDDDNGVADDDDHADGQYADGTYTGTADGYGGEIEVEVTIDNSEITDIEVVSHDETEGIGDEAMDELEDRVIEEQGTEGVDAVSGATDTSNAYLEAVDEALEEAREDAN